MSSHAFKSTHSLNELRSDEMVRIQTSRISETINHFIQIMKYNIRQHLLTLLKFIVTFSYFAQLTTAQLIAAIFSAQNSTINQVTSYTFQIQRYLDPFTRSFISPVDPVPLNSIVQIVFPNNYREISSESNPSCFNSNTNAALTCTVFETNKTIVVSDYYMTSSTLADQQLQIVVSNINNPNRAVSTSNFEYFISNENGDIIDQSPQANNPSYYLNLTFLPAQFESCSISANDHYVSTRSQLTFSVSPRNSIPVGGKLILDIPLLWQYDIDAENSVASTPTCEGVSGISGTISCSYQTLSSLVNIAKITITSLSTSGLSNDFSIDISSILTPPYVNSPETIQIYSQWADQVLIDQCSARVQNLQPINFQTISFTSLNDTIVQSPFSGQIQVTLNRPFNYEDEIILHLPTNFLVNKPIAMTSSNFGVFKKSINGQSVTVWDFPSFPSNRPTSSTITFQLDNIYNFQSVEPQLITITFYRQGEKYQQSSVNYTSTIAMLDLVTIESDNNYVNADSSATLTFRSNSLLVPTAAYIQMQYHPSIAAANQPETAVTSASLGEVLVSGVTYSVNNNLMTINSLISTPLAANSLIKVVIPTFYNPPTVQSTLYSFVFKTSQGYDIMTGTYYQVASLRPMSSNSIAASSYTVLASPVTYSLTISTNYGFKAISVIIPSEIQVSSGYQRTCSPNTFTSCTLDGTNLTFIGTMSAGSYTLEWGRNTNPNSFEPVSFEVFTYSSGWGVQRSFGLIDISMNITAELLSFYVTPSSYTNNEVINLTVGFSLPGNAPSGQISLSFPTELNITVTSCSGITSSCAIVPPRILIAYTNSDASSRQDFNFQINDVVNAPSFKPVNNISFSLVHLNGYQSIQSTTQAWSNSIPSTFVSEVSSGDGYRLEPALFSFSVSGMSGKQNYLNIEINPLFGDLTAAPSDSSLINPHEIRYSVSGVSQTQKSVTLVTPESSDNYTFLLKTYTQDDYLIGTSTTNDWQHNCFGTNCRACNTDGSCINCYDSNISHYSIFETETNECIRVCPEGSYLQGSNCNPCDGNCAECTQSPKQCTDCPASWFLETSYNRCVQQCPDTYFANPLDDTCTSCIAPCLQCSSSNNCTTCQSGSYLLNSKCLTDCPNDTMVANHVNRTCQFCTDNCLTCANFTNQCTSCVNSLNLVLDYNQCVSECSNNRFVKNGVCSACELPCRVCYNSTTTCSSCFVNQTRSLWYDYDCIEPSQCAVGHYVDLVNSSCDACPSECRRCSSQNECSACAVAFYLYSIECIDTCPNTTFANSTTLTCDECVGCETCSSQHQCTTCQADEYLYLGECYSTCPPSKFGKLDLGAVQEKVCEDCSNQCPTCLNATYCLSCLSDKSLYRGHCYTECPSTTYQASPRCIDCPSTSYQAFTRCMDCPSTCAYCTSASNCLNCSQGYSLENSSCVLNCAQGLSFQQVCYPCGLHCQDCVGTSCLQCQPNYYLHNGACVSECSLDTLTMDNQTCVPCTEQFPNCTTCSQTQCLSCNDGQLTNGQCLPCVDGKYSRNSFCVACPAACSICSSLTYCTECSQGYYMQANYCTQTCPDNKIPNGTRCDFCIENCAICNIDTSLCSICVAGRYMYQGYCVTECGSGTVLNLNSTVCITPEQYAQEYSQESKPIYFPMTIASSIVFVIGVILKYNSNAMHLRTFLVSMIAWLQLGSWILFIIIEYIFLNNQQLESLNGLICMATALAQFVACNLVFLAIYYRYFHGDTDFRKWVRNHECINLGFLVISTSISFKIHRIIYSKTLDREELSLCLSSPKKLIPISILSFVSMITSSGLAIVGSSLALYFSLNTDQEFFVALDTLTVTGIMIILTVLDLRHPHNYFIDELETQNIKNKIYQEENENFEDIHDSLGSQSKINHDSHQQLLKASHSNEEYVREPAFDKTVKKIRVSSQLQQQHQVQEPEQEAKQHQSNSESLEDQDNGMKWVAKAYDHHGYLIKYDENGDPHKYDQQGNRVEIDSDGIHHKYDQQGYEVKENEHGELVKYDKQGWIVGKDGLRYDDRGYRVVEKGDQMQFYDDNGYQVVKDQDGVDQLRDQHGNIVVIDKLSGKHTKYDESTGYQVIKDEKGSVTYLDKDGHHMRKNDQGLWEMYDPTDGFTLKENQSTGQLEKYDECGMRIGKDQFGNVYRYEPSTGYRVVYDDQGQIKRYDDQGYEIRKDIHGNQTRYDQDGYRVVVDPETGRKQFYDTHGYRVERDFYGNPTLYDSQGNMVIIDQQTGQHRKYNRQGLELVQNEEGKKFLRDKRGRRVEQLEDGTYQKYDEVGNKIWLDEYGYEVEMDEDGNMSKYDKVGDLVDFEDDQIELIEDEGDGAIAVHQSKRSHRKQFKVQKQFDYEGQFSKMVGPIIFEEESDHQSQLKQFHDYEPPQDKQLEKEYNALNELEREQGLNRTSSHNQLKLENLQEIPNAPWRNLKERRGGAGKREQGEQHQNQNQMTMNPDRQDDKYELKSVADASVDERSFENEGVQPMDRSKHSHSDQLESIEELDALAINRKPNKQRSHKSLNSFLKGNNVPITIKNKQGNPKIYDSDEEIESLEEEDWQNQSNPDIFYKNEHFSNANTKANERAAELDPHEDILSDYIPHQSLELNVRNKGSQDNLFGQKHMQSIEEVEDEMFDRLKRTKEMTQAKRTDFKMSGTPNPLVEYAKSLQANKLKSQAKNNRYQDQLVIRSQKKGK